MKTIEQWFNQHLPEEVRKKAFANTEADNKAKTKTVLKTKQPSLAAAIYQAFAWDQSPEGYPYWSNIRNRAMLGEFDPIQPDLAQPTTKEREPREAWNEEELSILRKLYPDNENDAIGRLIDRTASAVSNKARRLSLQKSPAYIAAHPPKPFKKLSFWKRLEKFLFG